MEHEMLFFAYSDQLIRSKNTSQAFWKNPELTDITLVSSDEKQIFAHEIILCTCSSFFKNIIFKNPHPKPLIYLKDVKHLVLISILAFIYLGSCEIANDILKDFFYLLAKNSTKDLIKMNLLQIALQILLVKVIFSQQCGMKQKYAIKAKMTNKI